MRSLSWLLVFMAATWCVSAGEQKTKETKPVVLKIGDRKYKILFAHMIFRDRTTPEIRIVKPGEDADRLKKFWQELSKKKSLSLDGERVVTRNGDKVREHYTQIVEPGDEDYPFAVYDNLRLKFNVDFGFVLRRLILSRTIKGRPEIVGRLEFHNPTPIAFFRSKKHPAEAERLLKIWQAISGEDGSMETDRQSEIELRYSKKAHEPRFFESTRKALEKKHGYTVVFEEEIR